MCEFKVGDVVRRIVTDNNPKAKIGQLATVVRVHDSDYSPPTIVVTYGDVKAATWFQHRAALVERCPLTPVNPPYVFKVGDKGQTNAGWGYEIVAEHNNRLVVVGQGENTSYMVDKFGQGLGCPVRLVAPKRILYGMEAVFKSSLPNSVKNQETRITLYNSAEHRKQDIAGMTGQGVWTIVRQWEEEV